MSEMMCGCEKVEWETGVVSWYGQLSETFGLATTLHQSSWPAAARDRATTRTTGTALDPRAGQPPAHAPTLTHSHTASTRYRLPVHRYRPPTPLVFLWTSSSPSTRSTQAPRPWPGDAAARQATEVQAPPVELPAAAAALLLPRRPPRTTLPRMQPTPPTPSESTSLPSLPPSPRDCLQLTA